MSTLKSESRFRGRVIEVTVDEVELPNGVRTELEVVHHPGGAAVVALDREERVCLLRQYRYVAGGWVWELPAGKLEPNEPPLVTAQRELAEEAGLAAQRWSKLGAYLSSPGVFSEVIHLYLATELASTPTAPESSEVLEVHWVAFAEAVRRAAGGDINDAKTALGLMCALHQKAAAPG